MSTTRPASHRGIPSLPVPGRRRAPEAHGFATFLIVLLATILLAAPHVAGEEQELRWIAYVRADSKLGPGGAAEVVRTDGRGGRTLIEDGVQGIDLGSGALAYVLKGGEATNSPLPTSVLWTSIAGGDPKSLYRANPHTRYGGVAASSDGSVAILRQVMESRKTPQFLSGGVGILRATRVPILVPAEEPIGTGGLVPSAEQESYRLLFTNDPAGALAHAQQVNVFVMGTTAEQGSIFDPNSDPNAKPVGVRGRQGRFFCGASACFLTWQELDMTYTVGEFGSEGDAVAFAESLIPIDALAGPLWREGETIRVPTPELIVRERGGEERVLNSVAGFCDCAFQPLDWSPGSDRLLVLATAEGDSRLLEYTLDGSEDPLEVGGGIADSEGRKVVSDAAYGPEGIVALFSAETGSPGTVLELEGGGVVARDVRAFDLEGTTLAYVRGDRDLVVSELSGRRKQTLSVDAVDVSVSPDVIPRSNEAAKPTTADRPPPLLLVGVLAVGVVVLLSGAVFVIRRRSRL